MVDFNSIVEKIQKATDLSELEALVKKIADHYETDHIAYHVVTSEHASRHYAITTYPQEWIRHYVSNNLVAIDPIVAESRTNVLPLDWSKVKKDKPEVKKMFDDAADIGLGTQGLTFQIRDQNSKFAILSVNMAADSVHFEKWSREYSRDLYMLACLIHNKVQSLNGIFPDSVRLSPRELEVLKWARIGKTADETAQILSISVRVTRGYLDSARNKLGAMNKAHAISRAIEMKIL